MTETDSTFAQRLLRWFDVHGRHDLPWQIERSPYTTWVSEVMLQQTQVSAVIPYFRRFIDRFPDVHALATADEDAVLAHWSGLGYYSRARNLHAAAKLCVELHDGHIPNDPDALLALPGIGRSTAGAILAQAYGLPYPILDGNVRRVLARYLGIEEWPGSAAAQRRLWDFAQNRVAADRTADYTQAQMDLGSMICKPRKPRCAECPLQSDCQALAMERTDRIPVAKPRRERPTRHAVAAILMHEDRVLLIKRPPAGIWSSLWTLPQADTTESLLDSLPRVAAQLAAPVALDPIEHAFSHYDLRLQPLHFGTIELSPQISDRNDVRWLGYAELNDVGLPAPIRTLLAHTILRKPQ